MFENLSEKLERSFKVLKGEGRITEINVAETLKEVRKALLDADVNYKVAKQFTDTVKAKAMGMNVLTAVKPGQLMVKIVHDELAELMGGQAVDIETNGSPAIILMSGLQGSGKTTFSGKLAQMLRTKRAKRPLLVACDVYRPAAIEQLRVLGEQIGVPVYTEPENKKPVEIAQNAIKEARKQNNDLVIIDTAGRLAVDEEMMNEIAALKKAVNPQEILFVVDAMTGQDAVNTAKAFNDRLDFTGVVLTKLDGDTRGGAALSIRTVVNKPIKFVGTGEKMEASRRIPSRTYGRSYPRHGRYCFSCRTCARTIRRRRSSPVAEKNSQKSVRLQRLHRADTAGKENGKPQRSRIDDSRCRKSHQRYRYRRRCIQEHRSHYTIDDSDRTQPPRSTQQQSTPTYRTR